MRGRFAAVGALACALAFMVGGAGAVPSTTVVISQVYGGGGNSGATLTNDFVELFNRGSSPVSLAGWSVQYTSSTGTSWQVTGLGGVTLQPGQYYLVQEAAGSGGTTPLPTPDATGSIAMSAASGKVALVSSTTTLTGACPTGLVDLVGYGAADCFEGSSGAPGLSNTTAALRADGGCTDTDQNGADFASGAPAPRNTASPFHACTGDSAPAVSSTTPTDGASGVALDANVSITFSEPVDVTGSWFSISCTTSGGHTAAVTGGPTTFTLDPAADFASAESCTVTVLAANVSDQDAVDPPDDMTADYVFGFTTPGAGAAHVTISEVYGGGGNSGATLTNDFVELYNPTASPVSLAGWSIQYASASGTTWQVTALSGSISSGRNYLVQEAAGAGGSVALPGPDAIGGIAMSGTSGKVALVSSATALTGSCPAGGAIVDFVGYGAANCSETSPTGTLSNTTSAQRKADGAQDTDDNSADFTVGAPDPHGTYPVVSATTPADGASGVALDANVSITFSEPVAVAGSWFTITCGTSGPHTASAAGGPTTYTLDPTADFVAGESCTVTVAAAGVTPALATNHVFSFAMMEPFVCGDPATFIHDVEGSGDASPLVGSTVTVEGVVVGDFQGTGSFGGFYVQEEDADADSDPATSEGIFVFTGGSPIAVSRGDVVRVRGRVSEFNELTELGNVSAGAVCATGASVTPTEVTMPFASPGFPERYEGMLVRLPQQLVISEYFNYDRFGELVLALPIDGESRPFTPTAVEEPGAAAQARLEANQLRRITLDDGLNSSNPPLLRHPNGDPFSLTNRFRGGDTVQNAVGVLTFGFGLYRIQPTGPAQYTAANPRPAAPAPLGGRVRVAAMNTLNFFVTGDYPTGDPLDNKCGPARDVECRGWDADQPDEFNRQRTKLLAALNGLDGDIVGLNELENTTGVEPLQSIVSGLPGYAYIDTGTIGTDAIKVGLIYKPAKVIPVGPFKLLTSAVDPRFLDSKNRPALAQTFEELASGARFTVVVNHLKSKGSDCNDVGDPDTGDGQGNCNGTRTAAARALVDWLATDPTGSGDPDFLIVGDLNSYAKEDPIDAVHAGPDDTAGTVDDYTNLVAHYLGTYAYSFVFDGMAGYLDHALSNSTLTGQVTGVAEWHINADEPDVLDYDTSFKPPEQDALYEPNAYRTSDHDPVLVGLEPQTTFDGLCRATRRYVTKDGVANALCAKLASAQEAEDAGDETTKASAVNAYVNQLNAQSGKSITEEQADFLIQLAGTL